LVSLPEFQLEPDQESYFGEADNGLFVDENGNPVDSTRTPPAGQQVDADGNPIAPRTSDPRVARGAEDQPAQDRPDDTQRLDQGWLDHVLGRDTPRPAPAPTRAPRDRSAIPPPEQRYDDRQDSRPTQ
jgi:penicillin-binding protein 1A